MKARLVPAIALLGLAACVQDNPNPPDGLLRTELGLTDDDRVHRVAVTGGASEQADPVALSIEPGSYVEFVTTDGLIHEIIFDADSVGREQWTFLERTDQTASPPLIERDTRYVLNFEGAPSGRYPYRLEGNGAAGRGVIIVAAPEAR